MPLKAFSGGGIYFPPADFSLRIGEDHGANKYRIEVFVQQLLANFKDIQASAWTRGVSKMVPPRDQNVF